MKELIEELKKLKRYNSYPMGEGMWLCFELEEEKEGEIIKYEELLKIIEKYESNL